MIYERWDKDIRYEMRDERLEMKCKMWEEIWDMDIWDVRYEKEKETVEDLTNFKKI